MSMKVRGRSLRHIQVQLAKRYLPNEVLQRPKQGFSSALPYMLKDEYRILFEFFLRKSRLADKGIFRQNTIDQLLREHLNGDADHGNRLWLVLNSEVWHRMFIEETEVRQLTEEIGVAVSDASSRAEAACAG
jgi:asparagine synthase (glutamine-hydrolysing)